MSQNTINIQPVENGLLSTMKYYRQQKQRPHKGYYEKDDALRRTMLRERTLSRENIHFAQRNKLPIFELVINDTTIDLSRHRGDMLQLLEKKGTGVLYEMLPVGVKQPIAFRRGGETFFIKG